MKFYPALLAAVLAVSLNAQAASEQGEKLFKQTCATCHGKQGEKMAMGQSAIIQQLTEQEIIEALQERRAGKVTGAGNKAKARLTDQDMQNLADFLQSLK